MLLIICYPINIINRYSHAVDMWSAGCVLGELELGRAMFPGKSEPEQLDLICRAIGTPTEDSWPGVNNIWDKGNNSTLPKGLQGVTKYVTNLKMSYNQKLSPDVLKLLEGILIADPNRR